MAADMIMGSLPGFHEVTVSGQIFSHPRRIGFGDCDPARIFFAPRAFDFAAEAIEAWFREALGIPFEALAAAGCRVEAQGARCDYSRSVAASQVVAVQVGTRAVGPGSLSVAAMGSVEGAPSFAVAFDLALLEPAGAPSPLLASVRERALARPAPAGWAAPAEGPGEGGPGGFLFHRQRRIRHGECTPWGGVYLPRVADLAVEAVGEWYEEVVGLSWIEQCRRALGTPFVSIRCDLHRPLAPGQLLDLSVRAPRLGRASIGYQVVGREPGGASCFEARMAACHITEASGTPVALPFPEEMRSRILSHQRACQAAGGPPG